MVRRRIWTDIFPAGCGILYDAEVRISITAELILGEAISNEFNQKPVEHPCYGCRRTLEECNLRKVKYNDKNNRYI